VQTGAESLRRIFTRRTLATIWSVERAIQLGMNRVILEMDATILGDAFRTTT
jgi:hypothetical protein